MAKKKNKVVEAKKITPGIGEDTRPGEVSLIAQFLEEAPDPNALLGTSVSMRTKDKTVATMEQSGTDLPGIAGFLKNKLMQLPHTITGDDKIADFVREVFEGIPNFDNILQEWFGAIKMGNAFVELVWDNNEVGQWIYRDLKTWEPRHFVYDKSYNLRKVKVNKSTAFLYDDQSQVDINDSEIVNPLKYQSMVFNSDYGSPIGTGLYSYIYWNWYMWKNAVKWWAILQEIVTMPKPIFMPDDPLSAFSESDRVVIDNYLKSPTAGKGLLLSIKASISYIGGDSVAKNNGDAYAKFIDSMRNTVAFIMHGTAAAIETGSAGTQARTQAQMEIIDTTMKAYIKTYKTFVDNLIKILVDVNFSNVETYPTWDMIIPEEKGKEFMEGIAMAVDKGVEVPASYIKDKMGIPDRVDNEPILVPASVPTGGPGEGGKEESKQFSQFIKDFVEIGNISLRN